MDIPAHLQIQLEDKRAEVAELEAPEGETTVAVKIIDMLGEEVLVTEEV